MEQLRQQQRAERLSIASSCCGVTGEVTLTDSAVILLFASALGAGDMLSLVTTSVLPFFNGLLIIPAAWFVSRIGRTRLILWSCGCAAAAYFLAASAPFFGRYAIGVLIATILAFSLSLPGFIAGWFPLLDSFLPEARRTAFLGRMRFFHQLSAIGFLFLVSLVIGRAPSVPQLQWVLFAGAVVFLGRLFFIARMPHFESARRDVPWGSGLRAAAANRHRLVSAASMTFRHRNITATPHRQRHHHGLPERRLLFNGQPDFGERFARKRYQRQRRPEFQADQRKGIAFTGTIAVVSQQFPGKEQFHGTVPAG